jgi:hypothetical protein
MSSALRPFAARRKSATCLPAIMVGLPPVPFSVTRREDVLAFYGDGAAVPPLAFSSTIKDMKALLHNA